MKKHTLALLLVSVLVFTLTSCGEKSLLRETDPVTLNFSICCVLFSKRST